MKTSLFALAALSLSGALISSAQADGFVCTTLDGQLGVKAYNHNAPSEGTRKGALLLITDESKGGEKTLAKFTSEAGDLRSFGNAYDIDLRSADESVKKLKLLGVELLTLNVISLDVEFSYGSPVKNGEALNGKLTFEKTDGSITEAAMNCIRYLKSGK